MTAPERFPHAIIGLLGLITIASYGAWYYSFGVLLDPILVDTGWSESWLSATYSMSTATGAVLAVPAGRLIDRVGSRAAFASAAVLSSTSLISASFATDPRVFTLGAVIGGASLQALAFYHVTQTTAVRAAPEEPARAIAVLTIYGAFSSTIYLPLAAALVSTTTWRVTLRILVLATAAVLIAGAAVVRERDRSTEERPTLDFAAAFGQPLARRFLIASGLIGVAVGTILVYQVPIMVDAGLTVGAAAWMAGARGAAQITGRIPLTWILRRLGARSSVRLAFTMITIGVVVLAFSSRVLVALIFVIVAGFGIGAASPLQGIYATELFDRANLGASMGVLTMIFGLSTAVGPALVGQLADRTGDRWWGIVIAATAGVLAVAQMSRPIPEPNPQPNASTKR